MRAAMALLVVLAVSAAAQQKVPVEVYSESLCPYCRQIVPDLLKFVQEPGILDAMDFDFVPYGNARNNSGRITCQHGADECYGNKVEACVKSQVNFQPLKYMPFVDCLEAQNSHMREADVERCARKFDLDVSAINSCVQGAQGTALINKEGHKTQQAHIPGTPTIHCNGRQVRDVDAAHRCVCNTWTGSKPAACSRLAQPRMCLRD